jgi:hypothetical protein
MRLVAIKRLAVVRAAIVRVAVVRVAVVRVYIEPHFCFYEHCINVDFYWAFKNFFFFMQDKLS